MYFFILTLLLGAMSLVSGAAFYPVRHASLTTESPTGCAAPETITTTLTVGIPTFITVINLDSASIASSLSRAASIDSLQVSESNENAPTMAPSNTKTPVFTHSIVVSGFTASEVNNGNSSIYFVSIGPNTTRWDYTPTPGVTIGYTTVTVAPVQTIISASAPAIANSTTNTTSYVFRTTLVTVKTTDHTAFTPYASGWNSTLSTNSTIAGPIGTEGSPGTTVTIHLPIATVTVNITGYPSFHYTGYGYPALTETASPEITGDSFGKRQASGVCTPVFATIDGQLASWCNKWDGSTNVQVSTYTTTLTPSPPPGIPSSLPPAKSAASISALSTTTEFVTEPTSTVSVTVVPVSSTTSAAPPATSCGQDGDFEINFDDLPVYSPPDNNTAQFPPLFNPYEHFFWGNGWSYVPPPNEPFPPQSGDHLAEYIPALQNNDTGSPDADTVPDSAFGCGPRAYDNNFWFNAQSAYVGCDNGATDPSVICDFVATGYQWDPATQKEIVVVTQHFPQPPCPNFQNCQLQQIYFGSQFTALTSLAFYANVQGQLKIYWVDTLEMSWWNSTCTAGLNRIRQE